MRVMVVSDSHGGNHYMLECIRVFETQIDAIIHLGDHIKDVDDIKRNFPNIKIYAVAGNNDYVSQSSESLIELDGYKLFLTHGHKYSPYSGVETLRYKGLEVGADVVLYGHTHSQLADYHDILILNPGSISLPRGNNIKSFAILELNNNNINYKFYGIFGDEIKEFYI